MSGQFGGYLTHYQNELDYIERIDRLTTVAEGRRNAPYARSIIVGQSSAKHCDEARKKSRPTNLK